MATSTTPHHRLTRKELREPDEFVSLVDAAGDYVADHLPRVIAGAIGVLVLILVGVGLRLYFNHQAQAAAEAFNSAGEVFDKKDYKAAADQFAALADEYPGTSLGRLALLYVGDARLAENQAATARDALQKFLAADDRPTFRQLALLQLGVAYEELANPAEALKAYAQAAAIKEGAQGRAELALARVTLGQGDKPAAIAIYQRFLRERPFDQERGEATDALSQLGVVPAVPISAKTLELPGN
jgi:predicted negative regulator of RcsB-dependent stress response